MCPGDEDDVSQIDNAVARPCILEPILVDNVNFSLTGLAATAANLIAEQTFTGFTPVLVGDIGWLFHSNAATNSVRAAYVRCTLNGSLIVGFQNATAGSLTAATPTAAAPYYLILIRTRQGL